ncbi:MAG: hypothetical protein WBG92_16400 [Thiohalocapsa sp.]
MIKHRLVGIAACASLLSASTLPAADCTPCDTEPTAGYPTAVVADYVIGCMLSNGVSAETLRKCACSMDFVANSIPYADYERIDTLLRLQQMPGGGRAAVYRDSSWAKNAVAHLREVQAESTLRCF